MAEQVPVYINISVCQASRHRTALELFIDRRLRRDTVNLFHEQEGYPPLHVLVAVPPFAVNGQRFNVNWKHWPWRIKLLACRSWRRLHRLRAR
ncbi:hypothetical protein DLM85_07320 [Hymenobacter edaphi]|uniref:Uncharacterized protein n=1 Tax=Hymenobacter edaphi TaxID=2211146 RepID=A0A328BVT8_9BACT|nr:hypothetical protein DLM85_07320 [Hymenobacter edaphi]